MKTQHAALGLGILWRKLNLMNGGNSPREKFLLGSLAFFLPWNGFGWPRAMAGGRARSLWGQSHYTKVHRMIAEALAQTKEGCSGTGWSLHGMGAEREKKERRAMLVLFTTIRRPANS